jgi:hypothetical protein
VNYDVILKIIQIALALVETGSAAATFLQGVTERVTAAQANGTDLTDADWAFLDAEAATNLAAINKLAGNT